MNRKISIVEADAEVVRQLKEHLEKLGHTVVGIHASGREALFCPPDPDPELILMDSRLPGDPDWLETAECVTRRYDIPVIFLLDNTADNVCEQAMAAGLFGGYLLKPVSGPELQLAIQIALCKRKVDSEKAQRTRELAEREEQLRDITLNLGIGVYSLDSQGRITFMNPMAEKLWGWTAQELNEHGPHDLVHGRRPDGTPLPREECRMHGVMNSRVPYVSADEVFVRKDGTVFPISVISTPLSKNGKYVGSVTAFRDITRDRRMEEELHKARKLESVGILAGGIAHDFNNLLTVIMGNIELAKISLDLNNPDQASCLLDEAFKASEAAKELSFRLLTFAKGGDPVRQPSAINEVLHKSAALALSGSSVSCHLEIGPQLSLVKIDRGQMLQVVNNILINAKEAMPQGGTVSIAANNAILTEDDHIPLPNGRYVHIAITDCGCGIAPENLSRAFDPYFSTKGMGKQKGTGLGLSICQSIVKKHDGHIVIESRQGQGTTVHIYLPASANGRGDETAGKGRRRSGTGPRRILFMDDDELLKNMVANLLEYLGYEVVFATSGEEAISLYRRSIDEDRPYCAVILDLTVRGGMGGDLAIHRLLEMDPEVKAVISSGYSDSPVMKNFRNYGFVEALCKPYRMEQIKAVLDRLLGPD